MAGVDKGGVLVAGVHSISSYNNKLDDSLNFRLDFYESRLSFLFEKRRELLFFRNSVTSSMLVMNFWIVSKSHTLL